MGDLIPFGSNGPVGVGREGRQVMREVRLAGLKLQGDAALYGLTFELTASLNQHRLTVLAAHPELEAILTAMLSNFALGADQKIQNRHSIFGRF